MGGPTMFGKIREKLTFYLSTLFLVNASAFSGYALSQTELDEIVVTARKKAESLQDVPLSVSALRESSMEDLGVNVFEDYLLQLPSVTAGGAGPGTSTIYIRGLASTTPNLTTAGVGGLAPNVSFYLDEQPMAQPGRNLDVYAADIGRIEVLKGPQGTLFGASSQAGVVRMITNKPVIGEASTNVEFESRHMSEGGNGDKAELVTNIPLGESTAARFVAYRDRKGGYIDQVAGTVDVSQSARFRPSGTVRANGLPVSAARNGMQASADLTGVTMPSANAIVKDDVNEVSYEGFRLSLAHEINDNWTALATYANQTIETDGVFFSDPTLGDLEVQRYHDDTLDDEFDNMSLTIEGSIGDLEIVYAGAYTDRNSEQTIDYTDYLFVGQYLPYYICDYYVAYPSSTSSSVPDAFLGNPYGDCGAPDMYVDSLTDSEVKTHEIRINAPISDTMSLTAGVFMSDLELLEHNKFTYPGALVSDVNWGVNHVLTDTSVYGYQALLNKGALKSKQYAAEGWTSGRGPYMPPVMFINDIKRTDKKRGVFGELSIDMSDTVELTLGARWYDIETDLEGSANASFGTGFGGGDQQRFGTNLSAAFNEPGVVTGNPFIDELNYPDKAESDGVIGKATLSWNKSEDVMYYVTWSEGFRPGLLNRPAGQSTPDGSYTVRPVTDSDEVTNYEFGWKSVLQDGRLRFNGSVFMVDISGLQTTIFDPSIANLFFSDNAADAEIMGLEGDFVYYPKVDGLMLSGAFSILNTEIEKSLTTSDVIAGEDLAFAPGFQANVAARYEWGLSSGNLGHVQGQVNISDESFSDIIEPNKAKQDSYSFANIRAGISNESWIAEIYIDNLTDKRAQISNNFVYDRFRVSYIRPRTMGLRYKYNF